MKKIYLIATTIVLSFSAFGQVTKNLPIVNAEERMNINTDKLINTQLYNFNKAPGDVIFSETFNGNMGGFTTTPGAMDTIWKFDTNGPDGQFSSTTNADIITSTTAGNGFMIFDADLSNPGPSSGFVDRIGALTSPAIDMTGITSAVISYENRYRTCCANAFFLKLQVSTDDFVTSETYNVSKVGQGVNADQGTFVSKVNVGNFLATATNLTNFKFRFFFDGAEGGSTSHYFWQVDDINVYESWTDDNTLVEHFMEAGPQGIPYYNMTLNQISPISFGGAIRNNGAATSNGTILTTTISTAGTGSVASTPIIGAIGGLDTVFTAAWTPTATSPGTYDFSHVVSATNADQDNSDNTITDAMNITTSVYSVDNGTSGGTFSNLSGNTGNEISVGNIMDIITNDYIESMSITLSSAAANAGGEIRGEIWKYDVNANEYQYLAETQLIEVGTPGYPNNTTITLNMAGGPVPVFAGDDLLVMQRNYGSVSVRTAQRVQTGLVAGDNNGVLYSLSNPRAIRVRLNMNPSVSLNELSENITVAEVSPNPTNNNSILNFTARSNENVSIQVVDVAGKVMQTEDLGNISTGGHSVNILSNDFKSGVYFVNIVSNNGVVTKKLIKK